MASLRERSNGTYSLVFWWKGKQHIKALGTNNLQEAEQIKKDAQEQIQRIRNGQSATASKLLADGHSIMDVLFGSDKIAHLVKKKADDNPFTLSDILGLNRSICFQNRALHDRISDRPLKAQMNLLSVKPY